MPRKKKSDAEGALPTGRAGGIPVYSAFDEIVDIDRLVENPKNPNRHPMAQVQLLARIISAHGWRAPIVVSKRSGFITKGHGRLKAAKLLEVPEVPVDWQEYENEAAEWADMMADNEIAAQAVRDEEERANLLKELEGMDYDLELTGLLNADIDEILKGVVPEKEPEPENPHVPDHSKPEEEFTQEVLESHNYVVLYFDSETDWLVAQSVFKIKPVHSDRSRKGFVRRGVGRVIRGAPIVERLKNAEEPV